jgi:hypothetical protein
LTIGNEAPVVLAGTALIHNLTPIELSGHTATDAIALGAAAGAATYTFSYLQQRAYGGVTRWGLRNFPRAIHSASLLAGSRESHMNDNYKSDGNAALVLGTSLAYLRHKIRNPDSTAKEETKVVKRGARAIAGLWAGIIGVSMMLAKSTQNAESLPILQAVNNITHIPNLALAAGAAYTGYEWFKLISGRNGSPVGINEQ